MHSDPAGRSIEQGPRRCVPGALLARDAPLLWEEERHNPPRLLDRSKAVNPPGAYLGGAAAPDSTTQTPDP